MTALSRLLAWLLALTLVALPLVAVLQGWMPGERWPLSRLLIEAEFERVSPEQVRAAVAAPAAAGFFAVDLAAVRNELEALPWVKSVEVRKHWPDTLELHLVEHRAFARWGEDRLLSDQGVVFRAPGGEHLQGLPLLDGPKARLGDVVKLYNQADEELRGTGLRIAEVRLTRRGSWSIRTADGAQWMLGRQEPLTRIERFVRVLPMVLSSSQGEIERADLRYANGFAIRWRQVLAPQSAQPEST
jgi:cell division protein FtsQ